MESAYCDNDHKEITAVVCVVDTEPYELELVRMQLSADIHVFTEANKVCCTHIYSALGFDFEIYSSEFS